MTENTSPPAPADDRDDATDAFATDAATDAFATDAATTAIDTDAATTAFATDAGTDAIDTDAATAAIDTDAATTAFATDAATTAFATTPLPAAPASPVEHALFLPPADPAASVGAADSVYAGAPVAAANDPAARPTVRWGAVVWALIFGGTAALTIWILVDPARRLAADAWIAGLNPLAAWLYALIAVGVVVALFGVVGLLRRGERARRAA